MAFCCPLAATQFDAAFGVGVASLITVYCLAILVNFRGAADYVVEPVWRPYLRTPANEVDERALRWGARVFGALGTAIGAFVAVEFALGLTS